MSTTPLPQALGLYFNDKTVNLLFLHCNWLSRVVSEQYDAYCERAKLYTDIHAKQKLNQDGSKSGSCTTSSAESRKPADQDKKDKKGKLMTKDKKRTLKRL